MPDWPTTRFFGKAELALHQSHHRIERIGDDDDKRIGRMGLDALGHRTENLAVGAKQIVPAHARLARDTRGHDTDIGAGNIFILVGADDVAVEPFNRAGVGQVERFTLRQAIDDIEQHHIAQTLEQRQMGHRTADVARANQCNFLPSHTSIFPMPKSIHQSRLLHVGR